MQALLFCLTSTGALALADVDLHHLIEWKAPVADVILEAGLGDTMTSGQVSRRSPPIAPAHLPTSRRLPGSDPAIGPRDYATIVAELRAELKRRNIDPPYVLVGHSLGGLYMQYFARNYPKEVAGLVLVGFEQLAPASAGDNSANTPTPGAAPSLVHALDLRRELNAAQRGEQVHASPHAVAVPTSYCRALAGRQANGVGQSDVGCMQDEIAADFPSEPRPRG